MEQLRKMSEDNANRFDSVSVLIAQISAKQDWQLDEIKQELKNQKQELTRAHEHLEARIESLEEAENSRSHDVQVRLTNLETKIASTPKTNPADNRRLELLERKVEQMEKSEIKNNIVIRGLKAEPRKFREAVKDFLETEFGAEGKIVDQRTIPNGKNSLYAVKLDSWETKNEILKKKKQLKGKDIFINSELTYKERQTGKRLRDLARQYRVEGHQVKIAHNKLEIDGIWHHWDHEEENLKKPQRPTTTTEQSSRPKNL